MPQAKALQTQAKVVSPVALGSGFTPYQGFLRDGLYVGRIVSLSALRPACPGPLFIFPSSARGMSGMAILAGESGAHDPIASSARASYVGRAGDSLPATKRPLTRSEEHTSE